MAVSNQDKAILQLADALRNLCLAIRDFPNYQKLPEYLKAQVGASYKKAERARTIITDNIG